MAEIGRWNGHKFEVSSSVIRGFTNLEIKGSSETEDKESGNQKYVSRKKGKPVEVTFTIHLNARLGCDVRTEAMKFITEAQGGKKDYFYVGSKKLVTCQLMLTDATVKGIGLISKGNWTRADVQVTMKQCSKNDGSSGGSGSSSGGSSGSKKTSVKKASTTTTKSTSIVQKVAAKAKTAVKSVVNAASSAVLGAKIGVAAVKKVTTTAKSTSTAKKSTTTNTAKAKITSVVSKVSSLLKKK